MILPCLTIRQPWAWLIVAGHKDVENRSWSRPYRGPLLIHAGLSLDEDGFDMAERMGIAVPEALHRGAIVGIVDLFDVSDRHKTRAAGEALSPWAFPDALHLRMRHARALPHQGLVGQQGMFNATVTRRETIEAIAAWRNEHRI